MIVANSTRRTLLAHSTTRSIVVLWVCTATILAFAMATAVPIAARARHDAERASAAMRETSHHARLIVSTHARVTQAVTDDPSRGGLAPRVTASLQLAGLPTGVLVSLSPEADTLVASDDGVRVVRRRATLVLSGVTLPQLGRFLEGWRIAEPAWTPVSIDLSPLGGKGPEAGGDAPLRTTVVVEALVMHDEGGSR